MTKTQILFKHMHDEHNLVLLDGELWEIIRIVKECLEEEYGSMETKIVNPKILYIMNHFEIRIMGGMEVSKRCLSLCHEHIQEYKYLKHKAVLDYYSEEEDTRSFDELDRILRLSNFMIAVYSERIIIISAHLKAYDLEVVTRLV